ncbi:5-hydroxytryptamine receptor 6, partial [Phalacrocorax carbo]
AGGSGPGRSALSPPRLLLQAPRAPSQPAAGSESRRFANKHSKKALKASLTLGILLGMFFVAWLPFFVTNVTQ